MKGLHSKVHSLEAFLHPSISLGDSDYSKLKQMFNHLSALPNRSLNLLDVQRALDYRIGTQSESFAVLTKLGWVVSGPMKDIRKQIVCHFASTEDVEIAENTQSWWDLETYAS